MPDTHCLPSGSLGTGELPVPNVTASTVSTLVPSSGLRRGVVVLCHGASSTSLAIPIPIINSTGLFGCAFLSLANLLTADGWVVIQPIYQEDTYDANPLLGIDTDINDDAGHGSRYLASTLRWWTHVLLYIQVTYGNWPVVPFGFSEGGMKALILANQVPSTIVAYGAHCPATIWSNVTGVSVSNSTGLDVTTSNLNSVSIPGVVGYGTNDVIVGYDTAGTGGTPVSNTDAMITNASGAPKPPTRNSTTDNHQLLSADATYYASTWFVNVVDPLCPKVY